MTMQTITAPRRGATVVVYEPRQSQDQEEVVLDTFELGPNEEREVDYPSATYAYRFEELYSRDEDGEEPPPPPDQEPRDIPVNEEELQAGRNAQESHEKRAASAKKAADAAEKRAEGKRRERETTPSGAPRKLAERRKDADEEDVKGNEERQVARAANPTTSPDPERRSASGKSGAELAEARGDAKPEEPKKQPSGRKG